MVLGMDSFREKFKDYAEYYTIIGGTACDISLRKKGYIRRVNGKRYGRREVV